MDWKNIHLSTIEEIVKTMDFDTISTMAMEDNEGAKNKERATDCVSESEMKSNLINRTNKKVSQVHFHIIW